ncbi:MAG: discoidin domain-containing protein [Kiritimatiellia bacterium]
MKGIAMKDTAKRGAGQTGRGLTALAGACVALAGSLANAAFTESKLNDIAVTDDSGAIIVYHSATGGTPSNAFDGDTSTYYENGNVRVAIGWVGLGIASPKNLTKIRYVPRSGQPYRIKNCLIQGANNEDFSDAVTLHVIENANNTSGSWLEENVSTEAGLCRTYRYFRLYAPNLYADNWGPNDTGSCGGNIAELEFYGGDLPVDESAPAEPVVNFADVINGMANFRLASRTEDAYGYEVQRRYEGETGWTSLVSIVGKTTSSDAVWLRAASSAAASATYRVCAVSPAGVSYREFSIPAVYGLTGTVLGNGNQYQKVYDGNPATFNDYTVEPSTGWAGQDFGAERTITGVRYVKREGGDGVRIRGAKFQIATTADFSDAETVYVAPTDYVPNFEVVTATFDQPVKARYARFYSSENGYGNIAECEWMTLPAPLETPSGISVVRDSLRDQYALISWEKPAIPALYGSVGVLRKAGDDGQFELVGQVDSEATSYVDSKLEFGVKVAYALSFIRTVEDVDYIGEVSAAADYCRAMRLERDWNDLTKVKAGVTVIGQLTGLASMYNVFDGNESTFANIYNPDGTDDGYALVGVDLGQGYRLAFSRVLPRQDGDGNARGPGSVLFGANTTEGWEGVQVSASMTFPSRSGASTLDWGEFASLDQATAYRYFWIRRPEGKGFCNYAELELYGYPTEVLTAPDDFTCVVSNGAVVMNWAGCSLATGYVVQRKAQDQSAWEDIAAVGADVLSYRDANLPLDRREYSYRVLSVGESGMRIPSPTGTIVQTIGLVITVR